MVKLIRICVLVLAVNLVAGTAAFAAPGFTLINVKHACGGQSNGSFDIRVNTVTGSPSGLRFEVLIFAAPPQIVVTEDITPMPGLPYVYSVTGLAGADYVVRVTQLGTGSSATVLPLTISDFTVDLVAVTPNTDATCGSPNGAIDVTTNGSSNAGPIAYTWTEAGGATYNTEDISGLPGGDYTLSYTDQPAGATTCTLGPIHVDDPVASPFHISSTDPAICVGEDLALEVDVSDIGYTYKVIEGVAVLASSVGNGGTLVINVPGLAAGNHTLTVSASQGCPATFNLPADLDVVVDVNPTITTGPTNQEVCEGVTSAIITYSATTGSPDLYSIDFDLAAEGANFVDVADAALAPLQITIDVPSDAPIATYNAILTVINSVTGCVSANIPITIKVNANPVIVPGTDPSVCAGVTTAFLPYGGAVGANEYSLDFDVAAEAENFADIGPLALPASPLGIAVPALAAPGTYNATLRVITTATACFTDYPITVTVIATPTIALGANPAVCFGTPTANLTYTGTTADEYTIDFDVAAEGEGFVDVAPFTALAAGPSQIAIAIPVGPGDGDPGTYLANLTIRNSATLCTTTIPIQVTINGNPTITPVSVALQVCRGTTSVNLPFSAVTDSPDQYSLDFDNVAQTALFTDVTNAPLGATPIIIVVPATAAVGTYNVLLSVRNSAAGCVSGTTAITIEVLTTPIVSPGAVPAVCSGFTATSIPYSVTAGTPDQYSIDYDAVANGQSFVDVGPLALPGVAVPVAVPAGATPGLYNGTLRISDSGNGCFSDYAFTVLINPLPTITGVADPQVCLGATTTSLTYTASANGPNQFSIVYGAGAIADGFLDVTNLAFTAPAAIPIVIPLTATATTYTGDLTVRNSVTGCVSVVEPFQITINPNPTLTPGANPSVCAGTTSADLTFAALVGGDQYSIDFNGAANTAGFIDVAATGPLTSPITIAVPALAAANTYSATLRVITSATSCFTDYPITVTVIANPTITLGANPAVCSGIASADLTYTATTGDEYRLDFDAIAEGVGFVDDIGFVALAAGPSQITIAVPPAGAAATYDANLIIRNTVTTCTSTVAVQVTILPLPTITGVADPQVCLGATTTSLTYTASANGPNQFSIVYGAGAIADGFLDVSNVAFTAPAAIPIAIPLTATATTYTGDLTVRNSVTGCVSVVEPFQIFINPNPTLTPGANPSVCAGTTSADLTFAALVGGDQYSIDFNGAANTAGFIDVGATGPLTSPITIAVPALAAANTYSATLRVITSATSCFTDYPITVTVIANPTITLGANPAVCSGIASADLTYTATTGDEYHLDFDAIAEGVGFVDDIGFVALAAGPSQITIAVPPAGAAATYDANLIIRNTVTTCTSTVAVQVTILPLPTITGVADPQVCLGATTTSLTYTATANGPNQFSIVYGAGAIADGFLDVSNVAFTAPAAIPIAIPLTATATTYTGDLTVRNSVTGCVSVVEPFQIFINPNPTLTPGANPSVCAGTTSADLTFAALVGGDQYSIDFNGAANTAGFIDVGATGPLTSPITIAVPALAAANTYSATLRVITSATSCFTDYPITVTVIANPTITLGANPAVCSGIASADLTYTATTGDEYHLDFDAIAEGVGFVDDIGFVALAAGPSQITIAVPPAGAAATYDANLIIRNTVTTCTSTVAVQVTILPLPTITGVADPQVCLGATTTSLTYTATANGPNQFSIVYGAGAIADGFLDVSNVAFTAPAAIPIAIPLTATATTYTGDLTVRNSVTGCVSVVEPFQIFINPNPTLTPGANPSVCAGTTSADLTFAALVGGDQYSIDFNGAANTAGFIDVGATGPLTSPITIAVPALAAANTYSATLRVITSATSCFTDYPITVTVIANPTITLGANPAVCSGIASADLTYTATTGDEYRLDFDAIAEGVGFVDDIGFVALAAGPSQITIAVPPAGAAATYDANLIIRNTATTCTSTVAIQVTIISLPTITGVVDPQVCLGATVTSLTYTATTNGANQFSIVYGATALADGFVNVSNLSFVSPAAIPVTIPPTAVATVYTADLTVRNSATGCVSAVTPVAITINGNPTLTLGPNPMVCLAGTNANLTYTATTASPDQYFIDFDAAAETAGFTDITLALPVSPISIPVPAATPFGVYNATITASNTVTSCVGTATAFTITVGIDATLGAIAPVCMNTSADIPYTPVIGSPDVYSIDFDVTAEAAGFVDVVDAALPVASITVAVPPNVAGVFNGSLTVKNSTSGCVSSVKPVALTIGTTVTLGPDPVICEGITTADLTYLATTGVPDQYSIDFDVIAEGAGFVDVTDVALTASPIVIVVPATAPAATYSYTVSVRNSANGCSSVVTSKTLIINSPATANAGLDETICAATTYFLVGSSVGSSALTGAWTITSQPAGGDGALSSSAQVADPTTISFSATAAGDYVLTLMTDDPAGPCIPAQDDVTITITSIPVVAVGQTKTICGNDDVAYEILLSPLNFPTNTLLSWPDPDGGGPATAGVNVPVGPAGTIHINDRLINHSLSNIGVTYQVTPSVGLCVGIQENITIVVQPSPVLQDLQATTICSGDVVGYEILLNPVNTPAGTMFSWPDPDGAGSGTSQLNIVADPAGKIHITDTLYNGTAAAIHVIYSIIATAPNGCRAVPRDIDVTVNPGAVVEAGSAQSICSSGTATLAGSSIGGLATAGTWSIFASPAGGDGSLSVTTATATPDVLTFTATIAGSYTLRLTTDDPAGSCLAVSEDVVITVRPSSDPACVGGILGTGDCTTVVIAPKPSPATCSNSDGSIIFTIKPFVPALLTTEVRIDIVGISPSNSTITRTVHNDSTFNNLPVGIYDYSIEYGDPSCIKTGQVTIDRSGTVDVPVFSNPVDPVCFGVASGSVTIDVPGETANLLEWSVDGIVWTPFIAGNTVAGMPAGSNIISVRRSSADACASGATLTLANPTQIVTTLTPSNATCNNNDGAITVGTVTGGTGPYSYTLNGQAVTLPANNILTGLVAGNQVFVVTDAVGCSATFIASVTFPGYVNHTVPVITQPDCTGAGGNGVISLQILDAGSFEFGITLDQVLEPTTYNPTGGANVTISNLPNGTYAVWLRSMSAGLQCATKEGNLVVAGVYPVSAQATNTSAVCFNDKAAIQITTVSGAPNLDYTYELTNTSDNSVVSGAITASQSLAPFTINNIDAGNYSLRILQDQSSINASCTAPIVSTPVALAVDGPTALLDTLSVVRKVSYPDLANGTANVIVSPSGQEPYEARLELVEPADPTQTFVQDWTVVNVNAQTLKFEYKFQDLFAGLYELRLRDAFGCERVFDVAIGSETAIMIPNIFTPNGDKVNDVFFIRNLPSDVTVVITNRWGKEVFKSNSYDNSWDGGNAADGVYYYRINFPDKSMTGWVEILRGQ